MSMKAIGRPPKYYFLIYRVNDRHLYSAATIAKLLIPNDLRMYPDLGSDLVEARFRARQSLARVARKHKLKPCGLVYLGPEHTGNAYPAYRGNRWKAMFRLAGYEPFLQGSSS